MDKRQLENLRKIRAYSIIAKGDMPKEVNDTTWVVPSQSTPNKTYTIWKEGTDYHCDCPDHREIIHSAVNGKFADIPAGEKDRRDDIGISC